jgi:hypothetical protein
MSPDLEWRVDDPSGEQTIAKTTAPRPPRWRWLALACVVVLGVGLGVLYRSIPEPAKPAPTPTLLPTLTPTAMPAALYQTLTREAQALADGDRSTLEGLTDIPNFERFKALVGNFEAWGKPTDAALYSILDFRLMSEDKAWVKVKQFRVGGYVQETRFYHLRNGEWRRTDFDPSFWSGPTETSDTPHFRFTYFIEDYDLVEPIASLLEADYEQLCTDFACPTTPETCVEALGQQWCSAFPREITVTFQMTGYLDSDKVDISNSGDLTFTVSSLRWLDQFAPRERESYFRNPAAWLHVIRLAYQTVTSQEPPPQGRALAVGIFFREYDRLLKRTGSDPLEMPAEYTQLDIENLPPLNSVWNEIDAANAAQSYSAANSVSTYIEQKFGWPAVTKLLKAIGPSKSLAEAIETSTGQSYTEFEQQWRAWAKSNTSAAP